MSVIIRLQGLPWSANAMDIRRFFQGLSIPEGGVHIVGGDLGDVFIAFTTDEDARQAMLLDGGKIKDSRLKLLLSSRVEMQKVIEAARNRNITIQTGIVSTNNSNVVPGNSTGVMGIMGNVASPILPGQVNLVSNPFDIQPQNMQQQQPQLVYVNRLALEQQQNLLQKQSVQVIDYAGASLAPTAGTPGGFNKSDQNREKEGGRTAEATGGRARSRDRDRSRDRERDRDKSKNRGRRRDRSRSPRRSRDRGGDEGSYRRRSHSREDDKDRRNNTDRYRDTDSRQDVSIINKTNETNNGNGNRFNEPAPSSRRGPSRWSRATSPVSTQQKREAEQVIVGTGGGTGNLPIGMTPPDNQAGWDKPGGAMRPPGINNESNFGGFAGQQRNLSPPRNTLVMVRGVPFNAMPVHVRDFFTGLSVGPDGINFAVDGRGERLPIVFVRFNSERDREMALRRPKQYLNNCVVEVLPTSEEEFRAAMGPNMLPSPPNRSSDNNNKSGNINNSRNCVVLQGLPPNVREGDVVRFLAGFNLKDVLIRYDNMGKTVGLCFVELVDQREAERCLEMNGQMLGPRHVDISLISKEEMDIQRAENRESRNNSGQQFGGGFPRNLPGTGGGFDSRDSDPRDNDCCLVRGLPFNAVNQDVFEFFAPSGCTPVAIHLMKDGNDRALGDAVCEFANSRQCNIALQLDGAPIRQGSRICLMVKQISRKELEDAVMTTGPHNANNMNNFNRGGGGPPNAQQRNNDPKFGLLGSNPEGRFLPPFQGGGGGGGGNFNNAPRFGGPGMPQVMLDHDNRVPPMMDDGGSHGRAGAGGRRMPSPPHSPQGMQQQFNRFPAAPNKFARPGTIIEVKNIPYRASTDDILDFFKGFNLNEDDIVRKYNNRNQPTGDARVLFLTPEDAQAAIRRLENQTIMGRTITLSIL